MKRIHQTFVMIALGPMTACGAHPTDSTEGSVSQGVTSSVSAETPTAPFPDRKWTWIPFAGAHCRDGSSTGIGFNLNATSTKVLIYMQGGGACYNSRTCGNTPANYGENDFLKFANDTTNFDEDSGSRGVFDRNYEGNPLKDWNFVYIPYCTGDVHSGNNPAGTPPGMDTPQQYVGYANVGLYLERIVPAFPNATQVLLTGTSAGGFGATLNYSQIAQAFGTIPVDMIDDSGPLLGAPWIASCLQDQWKGLWSLDQTALKDCGSDCQTPDDLTTAFVKHLTVTYPDRKFGLIDSAEDSNIAMFLGFGADNCSGFSPLTGSSFEAGLKATCNDLASQSNFGTFIFPGTDHTSLGLPVYVDRNINGTYLVDWIGAFLAGKVTSVGLVTQN